MVQITKEEALNRLKHSLEIKAAAKKRIEEQWKREGISNHVVLV